MPKFKVWEVKHEKKAKFVCPVCGKTSYLSDAFPEEEPTCKCGEEMEFQGWEIVETRRENKKMEKILSESPDLVESYRKFYIIEEVKQDED